MADTKVQWSASAVEALLARVVSLEAKLEESEQQHKVDQLRITALEDRVGGEEHGTKLMTRMRDRGVHACGHRHTMRIMREVWKSWEKLYHDKKRDREHEMVETLQGLMVRLHQDSADLEERVSQAQAHQTKELKFAIERIGSEVTQGEMERRRKMVMQKSARAVLKRRDEVTRKAFRAWDGHRDSKKRYRFLVQRGKEVLRQNKMKRTFRSWQLVRQRRLERITRARLKLLEVGGGRAAAGTGAPAGGAPASNTQLTELTTSVDSLRADYEEERERRRVDTGTMTHINEHMTVVYKAMERLAMDVDIQKISRAERQAHEDRALCMKRAFDTWKANTVELGGPRNTRLLAAVEARTQELERRLEFTTSITPNPYAASPR